MKLPFKPALLLTHWLLLGELLIFLNLSFSYKQTHNYHFNGFGGTSDMGMEYC